MNKLYPFEPTLPIPPGETIRMILEHLGMTQAELATRLGYSRKYVNQLLHGVVAVTPEAAVKLEAVLGPPASFWNSAEQSYRELRAKAEQEDALRGQLGLAKLMPYNELAKLGRVPDTRKALERARNLLGFFAVASLDTVEVQYEAAFRHAQSQDPSPYALACWLRLGELEALGRDVARYDEGGLKRALPRLRKLSVISTTSFQDELTAILARNGVDRKSVV
jgi:HTH-type transcriptional regulator/antitoxin HigA